MKYYISCLYITFLLISVAAQAQTYSFKHYGVEQGLANNRVFGSYQDKEGFLWFATLDGLNRFDGYQFKLFALEKNNRKLPVQAIYGLTTDKRGIIWLATQNGLFYFDREQQKLVSILDSVGSCFQVTVDDSDNLWILGWGQFWRYNLASKKLFSYPHGQFFAASGVCTSGDGSIWLSSNDKFIRKYNPESEGFTAFNIFSHSPSPGNITESQICYIGNDNFLVGTDVQGLKVFNRRSGEYKDILTYNPDKTPIFVRSILQYGPDEFWIGTESGIFIVSLKKKGALHLQNKFSEPNSLSDNTINTLYKDSEGGVWAGTFFGGVNYYSPRFSSFSKYFPDDSKTSVSGSAVREICQDPDGNIWIGTEDAGLNKLDTRTGAIRQFRSTGSPWDISSNNIQSLVCVGTDLWIGTYRHGIDVIDIKTGRVRKHYQSGDRPGELKNDVIRSLSKTASGELLIGTYYGAYRYNATTDNFSFLPGLPFSGETKPVAEDRDKGLWIVQWTNGIFYQNPATGKTVHYTSIGEGTSIQYANDLTVDSKNNTWICLENGGLVRWAGDRKSFVHYTTSDGLPSNYVFKAVEDNRGDIWITTAKGLVNIHRGKGPISVYTTADGLLSDQFNYTSGFKDSSGRLYFGSIKGMVSFRPEDIIQNIKAPPLYITSFQVEGKEELTGEQKSIILPHNQSTFNIGFAALSYAASSKIRYYYKMEGLNSPWILLESNHRVSFLDLSPGKYLFKIRAELPGRWKTAEQQLSVEVTPPIWATKWAYALYGAAIIALLFAYIRYTKNRQRLKIEIKHVQQLRKYNSDMRIKNDELQKMFNSLEHSHQENNRIVKIVAHDLKNPISGISNLVYSLLRKDLSIDFREILEIIGDGCSNSLALIKDLLSEKKGLRDIEKEVVDIGKLMSQCVELLQAKASEKKQHLICQSEHALIRINRQKIWRAVSNIVNNAIKFSPENTDIYIDMQKKEKAILLSVRDKGIGIPPELQDKIFMLAPEASREGTAGEESHGLGLSITQKIVEEHHGKIWFESQNGEGSVFYIELPFPN